MADQVQCPNDGGYKVEVKRTEAIMGAKQLSQEGWREHNKQQSPLYFAIGIGALLCGGLFALSGKNGTFDLIMAALAGFVGVCVLLTAFNLRNAKPTGAASRTIEVQVGTRYYYECKLCGYEWSWDSGTPKPSVTVRPDLIQKSSKKLEDDAAAAWYFEQQQKQ